MKIEAKNLCPLNRFEKCKQLDCAWFLQIQGKNPQTGADIDEWGCSISWLPLLMIENSQQQRQTGAAVESFRNEMVKSNEVGQNILLASVETIHRNNFNPIILENKE
jgi:hypothetical protein